MQRNRDNRLRGELRYFRIGALEKQLREWFRKVKGSCIFELVYGVE
jgi:hypothetical protein